MKRNSVQLLKKTSVLFLAVTLLGFTNPNDIEVSTTVPLTGHEGTTKNVFSVPQIGALDEDVVPWPGVGNSVVLDASGNAFVRDGDYEPLNGGNGNWATAVLKVDRLTGANSKDKYDFNILGASFTDTDINGNGNLQVGGQIFATYTNSWAGLAITFTSSGTVATTALVNEVLRRITYGNDTPAGDARIRITLNDGTGTTAVGVTVSCDDIYVTDQVDKVDIDYTDGVSFSEAVAIAKGQTGAQTIVFSSILAEKTITLAGNLVIDEDLIINVGAANVIILDGSTISVSSGKFLTFSNSTGEIFINTVINGAGSIRKEGAGFATLLKRIETTSITSVLGGTMTVIGSSSGISVFNGSTLRAFGSVGDIIVYNGGVLSPGPNLNDAGMLPINGNLKMHPGSTLSIQIRGAAAGTGYDQMIVDGTVDVSGATLDVFHGYTAGMSDSYTIIANDNADAVTGTFSGLAEGSSVAAGGNSTVLTASYIGGTGNDFTLTSGPLNTAPSISNLNGDNVAWPDVGNTVTLDAGGNATVTDIELDASNWNGASLTVQRISTPLVSDIFSFNESGYSVNGGNLQTGGSTTFGTFTNASGVLSINFNANATNTLVRDVVRGIRYRNDTPAGDATIRFTLSDGNSTATADVSVTSDIIYVTNTTDAQVFNLADGVSFSEAVAIAADDVTGRQTIKIASTLTDQTVSTSSAGTLNENLTLDLSAANGVTFSGGSLSIAPGVALTVANGANDTTTFTTALTGSGSFTKLGTGTLILNGASTTYTGSLIVGQGVLTVAHNNALGTTASGVIVSSGASLRIADGITIADALNLSGSGNNASGALQLISGTATVSGNINLLTTVVSINSAGALSLSGVIGGTNLVSNGTGSLILSGTNHYGNTTVSAGTLSIASDNHLGFNPITLGSGTTLAVTGATTIDNGITLTGAATISNAANVTIDGVISGAHNLTKAGLGMLMLERANTYAATNVDAGTLSVSSDSNLGSGAITLAAGTTLAINGATTIDNAIALTGAATISNAANATIDGVISGAHNLTKTGSATLTLAASNTYSGNTIVSAGGLTLTGGSSIGDGSAVSVASGATLTLGGGTETIGSLLGDGNIVLGYNLTTGGNNASTTFSGVISGTGNGITKTGSGTFTLSGSNTYTGSTNVSAGTLALSGGAAISDASVVAVSSGATISLNASETLGSLAGAGNVSLNGFTLTSGDNNTSTTFSGALAGSGGFTKTGSGTLILSGNNSGTFIGGTTVSGGTLNVASDANLGAGTLSINNSTFGITGATTIDNSIALTNSATISNTSAVTLSGAISGSGSLLKAGSGVLSLSGTSNYGGSTTVLAGTLSVTGALNGTSAVSVSSGATLTGSGSVTNLIVSSGGTLSPGNSPGVFTVNGNLQMNSGSTLAVEINGVTAGTDYDQVIVNGMVSVAGTLVVNHGYAAGQGDSYTIIVNDMADFLTGTFAGLAEGGSVTAGGNGTVLTGSYIGGTGNDFTLTAPTNASPVIGNLNGDHVNFIEDSALVLLDAGSDATLTDGDSVDLDGGNVTVSIVANRVNTEDILSIQNQGTAGGQIGTSGLNITYGGTIIGTRTVNGGTDTHDLVITLNSSATAAIVQALIRNLTYINTNTTVPTTTTRSVRVTVNDGDGGTSSNAIISVGVVGINDSPTLTAIGGTPTFTEGGSGVDLFSAVGIDPIESGELIKKLVFTISNVTNGSSEVITVDGSVIPLTNGFSVITANNAIGASVVVTGSTATLTLTKTTGISVAAAQTLVDAMTYSNSSVNPTVATRTVTITAIQDNGGTANGGVDTSSTNVSATVTVVAVNSIPVVTNSSGSTAFTEGNNVVSTPVVIDAGVTLTDLDNTTFAAATVAITGNFHSAEDILIFVNISGTMGDISANYNGNTGVMRLTSANASATTAQWQAALRAVTYSNSSEIPNIANRTISFSVNDGISDSDTANKIVTVTSVNDRPIISGSPVLSINQGAAYSFTPLANDVDSPVLQFSIVNKPSWAVFDTATGALSGTPGHANVGTTTGILITVTDGMSMASLSAFNLTVVNVNDAPTITGSPATSVNQDDVYSFTPTGNDIDGDALEYSIVNKPDWADFDTATGKLTGMPNYTDVGITTGITITVSDGTLSSSLPAFTIMVITKVITGVSLSDKSFVYDGREKQLAFEGLLPANSSVSYVNNGRTVVGGQTVTIHLLAPGYTPFEQTARLTITKAVIPNITFDNASFVYDGTVKSLAIVGVLPAGASVSYVNNDKIDVGDYTVTAHIDGGTNYESTSSTAVLTITKAKQQITFNEIGTVARDANRVPLNVSSTSGLSVNVKSDDPMVAAVNGQEILIHRLGTVRLTATQEGDKNHEAATPVSIIVQVADETKGPIKVHPALSPNGDGINDFLIIEGIKDFAENKVQVVTRNGLVVFKMDGYDNDTHVFRGNGNTSFASGELPAGTYFYIVEYKDGGKWRVRKGWFVIKF